MTREELEERLSALEAQHQRDIALLTAAHAARVRSLLSLWQPAAQPIAAEAQPGAAEAHSVAVLAAAPEPPAPSPAPAPPPEPAPPRRRERNSVLIDLLEALPELPETFDKHDVARVLGYAPPRATLFRALSTLEAGGRITTVSTSIGGTETTRHRKLAPAE